MSSDATPTRARGRPRSLVALLLGWLTRTVVVAAVLTAGLAAAAADPTVAAPEPVTTLGLPDYNPGSLSESQTRTVYTQGELRMRHLDERLAGEGVSLQDRARIMVTQRNALRSWARTLMRDRTLADELNADDPNLTFDDLVAKNRAKGLTGDDLYNAMITSATASRAGVNDSLGIDPERPPPLPPILPSQPFYGGIIESGS